ncbi:hypothetical protein DFH27DRAFT_562581 [Peziza echinospora]|nr:hypothetical protein DFH27DRAFT_562581 [Peziza echinospora]
MNLITLGIVLLPVLGSDGGVIRLGVAKRGGCVLGGSCELWSELRRSHHPTPVCECKRQTTVKCQKRDRLSGHKQSILLTGNSLTYSCISTPVQ